MMYTPTMKICAPFILTEENIRRISTIFTERIPSNLPKNAKWELIYTTTHKDNCINKTSDIAKVFEQENRGVNRIVGLKIEFNKNEFDNYMYEFEFVIDFNSYENKNYNRYGIVSFSSISFDIKGEDRDFVGVLFSNICTYIQNSIITAYNQKWINLLRKFTLPKLLLSSALYVLVLMLVSSISADSNTSQVNEIINNAIASSDISMKLNTLLSIHLEDESQGIFQPYQVPIIAGTVVFFLVLIISVILTNKRIKDKANSLLPFVFDFGTYPEKYLSRIRFLKFMITAFISVILSVLGNIIWSLIS